MWSIDCVLLPHCLYCCRDNDQLAPCPFFAPCPVHLQLTSQGNALFLIFKIPSQIFLFLMLLLEPRRLPHPMRMQSLPCVDRLELSEQLQPHSCHAGPCKQGLDNLKGLEAVWHLHHSPRLNQSLECQCTCGSTCAECTCVQYVLPVCADSRISVKANACPSFVNERVEIQNAQPG